MTIHWPVQRVNAGSLAIDTEPAAKSIAMQRRLPAPHLIDGFRFVLLRANAMLLAGGLLGLSSYDAFLNGTHYGYLPGAVAAILVAMGVRDLSKTL